MVLESSDDTKVSADEDGHKKGNDSNNLIISTTISSSTVPPIIPVGDVVNLYNNHQKLEISTTNNLLLINAVVHDINFHNGLRER